MIQKVLIGRENKYGSGKLGKTKEDKGCQKKGWGRDTHDILKVTQVEEQRWQEEHW